MPLAPGVRLGAYEIVGLVGSGGMGEVYRAHDARLGRDVAIKVLTALATDAERLRRFEQEARAAAALNHPNIIAVHDVGTADAVPYVVSELLEGQTLRERLTGGPLPVRKAVDAAIQIAHGLAAAHDKGIVHRDLKPENVFITDDGRLKILDFGLAKLTEREPAISGASALATAPPDTLPGVVLGTIGYMAPEQVRGRATDHRSDIFAFGSILYEMLSGQRAFKGDTGADTMTAILKEDPPDLPAAERHIPSALGRIVDRCLEKNPSARFQSAGDLAFALEALTAATSSSAAHAAVDAVVPSTGGRSSRLPWILVGVLATGFAVAAGLAASMYFRHALVDTQAIRFSISPPEGWSIAATAGGGNGAALAPLAIAPDGSRIAFIGRSADGKDMLWVRRLDSLSAQALPGTEGVRSPFWSPDSRFLGFFAQGKLKRIDVAGGPPVTVCDAPNGTDGAWSRDGVIVFTLLNPAPSPLMRVPASGGIPARATTLGKDDTKHVRPVFLPDGRHLIYRMLGSGMRGPMYLGTLDSTERTRLLDSDSTNVAYSSGHLLFMRESTLMAQQLDPVALTLKGEPFPVAESVQSVGSVASALTFQALFAASENGTLVYQTGGSAPLPTLTWFDRSGKSAGIVGESAAYGDFEVSPDGKQAAVVVSDSAQNRDVWIIDLARRVRTRFTVDPAEENSPTWSPDGARVAFASGRKGHLDLYQRIANGSGSDELLFADDVDKVPTSWSPDGRFLLYFSVSASTSADLWVLPMTGERKPFPYLKTNFAEGSGRFSPDGRWIAYVSTESGRTEVYVAPFPGPGGKWRVSTGGAAQPRWRRDGKELFFRENGTGRLMAATVRIDGATFEVGEITPLFPISAGGARFQYDVTADGGQFLVNTLPADTPAVSARALNVVVNWPATIRK